MCFWKGFSDFLSNQYLFTNLFVCFCRRKLSWRCFFCCFALFCSPCVFLAAWRWREGQLQLCWLQPFQLLPPARAREPLLYGGAGLAAALRLPTAFSPVPSGSLQPLLLVLKAGEGCAQPLFPPGGCRTPVCPHQPLLQAPPSSPVVPPSILYDPSPVVALGFYSHHREPSRYSSFRFTRSKTRSSWSIALPPAALLPPLLPPAPSQSPSGRCSSPSLPRLSFSFHSSPFLPFLPPCHRRSLPADRDRGSARLRHLAAASSWRSSSCSHSS